MNKNNILFFEEDINFKINNPDKITKWINASALRENKVLKHINIIFCSDTYLNNINVDYLNHDTYTDIITFDNSEDISHLEGDLYISVDRVKQNSQKYNENFNKELYRVIIHGILHLIGYDDKDDDSKMIIRSKEDEYLKVFIRDL